MALSDVLVEVSAEASAARYPGLEEFAAWYSGVHGYVATVVCTWGVVANMANIVVLTRRSMITSTNIILTWLAVADLLTMSCFLPFGGHFYIGRDSVLEFPSTRSSAWIGYFLFYINFSVVCHTVAVWLTITLAIFRYLCICCPTRGAQLCSLHKARMAVLAVYVTSAVICIPNYFATESVERQWSDQLKADSLSIANATDTDLSAIDSNAAAAATLTPEVVTNFTSVPGFTYYTVNDVDGVLPQVNYWIQALFIKLIPCVLLTALTVMLVVAMHEANVRRMKLKSQGRQDESDRAREHNRTTAMLLAVVGLFQLVELPHGVLTLCSFFVDGFHQHVYWPLGDIIDIMALLNNSINFVLYCTMSRQFRQQFVETFCCRQPSPSTQLSRHAQTSGRLSTPSGPGWTKLRVMHLVTTSSTKTSSPPAATGNGPLLPVDIGTDDNKTEAS